MTDDLKPLPEAILPVIERLAEKRVRQRELTLEIRFIAAYGDDWKQHCARVIQPEHHAADVREEAAFLRLTIQHARF